MTFIYGNGLDYTDSPFAYATPTMYRDIATDTDEVIRLGFSSGSTLEFSDSAQSWSGCNISLSLVPDYGKGVYYLHDYRRPGSKVAHRYLPEIMATLDEAEEVFAVMHRNVPWFFYITENDKDPRLGRVYEHRLARHGFTKTRLWDEYAGEDFNALVRFPNGAQ